MSSGSMRVNLIPLPTWGSHVTTAPSTSNVSSSCNFSSIVVPTGKGKNVSI